MSVKSILLEQQMSVATQNIILRLQDKGVDLNEIPKGKFIGSGYQGVVYEIPDSTKVMKIEQESQQYIDRKVKSGEKIIGKEFDYVCRLYFIKAYKGYGKPTAVSVWEYLEQPDRRIINDTKSYYQDWMSVLKFLSSYSESELPEVYNRWKEENGYDDISPETEKILFDTYRGWGELNEHNVFAYDTQLGNLMYDPKNENYKMIDFL